MSRIPPIRFDVLGYVQYPAALFNIQAGAPSAEAASGNQRCGPNSFCFFLAALYSN